MDCERKLSQRILNRQLAWVVEHGNQAATMETLALFKLISPIPRALVDGKGLPYKGSKSTTTTYLKNRYKQLPVVTSTLPEGWAPEVAILDLIQTSPIPTTTCMEDYVHLLLSRFIHPQFTAGVAEIHLCLIIQEDSQRHLKSEKGPIFRKRRVSPQLPTVQQY